VFLVRKSLSPEMRVGMRLWLVISKVAVMLVIGVGTRLPVRVIVGTKLSLAVNGLFELTFPSVVVVVS
jgi:hypothetical protein